MPRLLLALLALAVASCGDAPDAPAPDPTEVLARQVFDALQQDDVERLSSAHVTADDLTWMAVRYRESAPPKMQHFLDEVIATEGGPEKLAEKYRAKAEEAFRKARASSAKVVDWKNAEFLGLVEEHSAPKMENGVEHAVLHFVVKSGEREELFVVDRAVFARGRWATMRGVKHQRSPHGSLEEAQVLQTKQHLKSLETVIHMFQMEHGRLPAGMEELFQDSPGMKHPYLKEGVSDAWGNPFAYEAVGADAYRLKSPGPDGDLDTEDDVVWPETDD